MQTVQCAETSFRRFSPVPAVVSADLRARFNGNVRFSNRPVGVKRLLSTRTSGLGGKLPFVRCARQLSLELGRKTDFDALK